MGYVELQYQLTQEGMTVEQVDYLESDARFSLALQVTAINLAIAGIKIIGQIASSEHADPELESQITTKFENKIISNKGNVYNNRSALIHTSTKKNPGYQGVPNSSVDILDSKTGKIKTRRWFGPDGKAERDLDMANHNNPKMHPEVPHEHLWEYAADGTPIRR